MVKDTDGPQWQIQDFLWGGGGGGPPMRALFSEMYAKTKELGPMGGGGGCAPGTPPRSAIGPTVWFDGPMSFLGLSLCLEPLPSALSLEPFYLFYNLLHNCSLLHIPLLTCYI